MDYVNIIDPNPAQYKSTKRKRIKLRIPSLLIPARLQSNKEEGGRFEETRGSEEHGNLTGTGELNKNFHRELRIFIIALKNRVIIAQEDRGTHQGALEDKGKLRISSDCIKARPLKSTLSSRSSLRISVWRFNLTPWLPCDPPSPCLCPTKISESQLRTVTIDRSLGQIGECPRLSSTSS